MVVGCHYFPLCPLLLSAADYHRHIAGAKLCCLVTEAGGCEQLAHSQAPTLSRTCDH